MKGIRVLCLAFFLILIGSAQSIEHMVSYQGKLTNSSGIGINGTYDIHFRIYDAASGGSLIDSATVSSVTIERGLFSVNIPFDISMGDLSGDMYLAIWVDGDEMTPRQLITAELLSFRAHVADSASAVAWEDITGTPLVTLQDAYNAGTAITIDGDEVDIDAPESAPDAGDGGRALDVTGNDDVDEVFRAYNAGDGPAIFSSGHLRINGAKKFYSTTDLKLQLDNGGSPSTTNSFQIRDDADVTVFEVDELGYVETARLLLNDVQDDPAPANVLTIDGSGNVLKAAMPSGGEDGDWSLVGTDLYNTDLTNVSIGQSTAPAVANRLEVYGTGETAEKAIVGMATTGPEGWLGTSIYGAYGEFDEFNYGALGVSGIGILATGATYAGRFEGDVFVTGGIADSDEELGTAGQILSSTATGTDWIDAPTGTGGSPDSFFVQNQDSAAQDADMWIAGTATFGGTMGAIYFEDNFSTDLGWTLEAGSEWERAACAGLGGLYPDPTEDVTPDNADNMVLGYDLTGLGSNPGDYETSQPEYSATSPIIDCGTATGNVNLAFWRMLGVESSSWDHASIDVWDGASWQTIWDHTGGSLIETDWSYQTYDVTEYAAGNSDFQVRFIMGTTDVVTEYFGWNIDDIMVYEGLNQVEVAAGDLSAGSLTLSGESITSWDDFVQSVDTLRGEAVDTIVVMNDFKVHGELIADSIQAVGSVVTIDDDLDVAGCISSSSVAMTSIYNESFDGGSTPTGWSIEDATGGSAITFVTSTTYPSGIPPSDGTHLVRYNSYNVSSGSIQLEQTTSVSTLGYSDVILNFDLYHDTGYTSSADRVTVRYSTDGLAWTDIETYNRYNGTVGWETIELTLPPACADIADLYIAFLFTSGYGNDVHIDNMVLNAGSIASIDLCGGDIAATGDIEAGSFTLDGATITEWPSGSGGGGSLQDAYDGGNTVTIGPAGEIAIDAPESVPDAGDGGRALDVTGNDNTDDGVFRAYNAGDGPAIFSSGHLRINGAKKFYSTTDLKFQLDKGGSSSSTNEFQIRDDADDYVFTVDEDGVVDLPKAIHGNNARTDWEPENVITVAPANADFTDLDAAITYANANAPMTIEVAPGTYTISTSTLEPNVALVGSGMSNTQVLGAEMAGLSITIDAEVHNIDLALEVFNSGSIFQSSITGASFTMDAGKISDCVISTMTTVNTESAVVIEGSRLSDIEITGNVTISDCAIFSPELGLNGTSPCNIHLTGCEVYGAVVLSGEEALIYAEGNIFSIMGVQLDGMAAGEFKANHFVHCATALTAMGPSDLTLIANDFIGFTENAINLDMIDSVTIMDNRIDGQESGIFGINVNNVFGGLIIKGNVITSCQTGIMTLPMPMPGSVLITHNTLISNSVNDLSAGVSVVVSYNTLDSYMNFGMGAAIPGCLNQNSAGTLYSGAPQIGQLP